MARLHDVDALIEDATFIADTGAGLTEAARRLGFTNAATLERYLHRLHQYTLAARLRANDPLPVSVIHGRHHRNQWSA